jgi:hypothetical protein
LVAVSLAIGKLLRFDSLKLGIDVLRLRLLGLLLTWLRMGILDLFQPASVLKSDRAVVLTSPSQGGISLAEPRHQLRISLFCNRA